VFVFYLGCPPLMSHSRTDQKPCPCIERFLRSTWVRFCCAQLRLSYSISSLSFRCCVVRPPRLFLSSLNENFSLARLFPEVVVTLFLGRSFRRLVGRPSSRWDFSCPPLEGITPRFLVVANRLRFETSFFSPRFVSPPFPLLRTNTYGRPRNFSLWLARSPSGPNRT